MTVCFILITIGIIWLLIDYILSYFNSNVPKEKNNKGKFAILIPARDESRVIEELLNSILNQTRKIDSDDVYLINRLERLLQVFAQYKDCDIVFSRHKEFKGKRNINEVIDSGKVEFSTDNILKRVISNSNNHFMWNVMLKTEIAKKEKFASIRFAEDFCYIRDCAWHCRQMAVLDEVLYFYRRDNENAMTSHFFSEKYIIDYMKLVENVYDFCKEHKLEEEFYKKMVAHEYVQNSMRIRKSTSYLKFVTCMNDVKFREGIEFADASQCTLFEKIVFCMVKHKIYFPFAFWVW